MSGYNKKPRKSRSSSGGSRLRVVPGGYQPHVVPGVNTGSTRPGSFPPGFTGSSASAVSGGPLGKGFGSDLPPITGSDPNFQNPYTGKDGSRGDGISRLFDSMNKGGNPLQNLLSLLNNEYWNNEFWSMFMQYALQQSANKDQRLYDQSLTKDQREYDWNMLQDSRLYNNPANELARLMGSGISRDAAIQILSGSAGGSGVGSGSSPVVGSASQVASPTGTPGNQNIDIANTVMSGVQLISNLVGQGFSLAQSVEQTKLLRNQSYMSEAQLSAFQGINDITNAFNNAVFDGTLTVEDVQSLRSADDYYKYITDHSDTNLVKPLIQSGAVKHAFGSTIGRSMMNQHLDSMRQARDADKLFDNYLRSTELENDLKSVDVVTQYQEVSKGIYDILMKEPELLSRWQELMSQANEYEIRKLYKSEAEYNAYMATKGLEIARRVYEPASNGGIGTDKNTGVEMVAFTQWRDLHRAQLKALAEHDFGDDYWTKFFSSNVKTAAAIQFLKENQAKFASLSLDPNGPNPFWASILNTVKILTESGAWNVTDQFFNAANVGLNAFDTFDPVKPK